MTRRSRRRQHTAPSVSPAARSTPWTLRIGGLLLATLGIVPVANLVTTGVGLPWWRSAVIEWLEWNAGIIALALLLGALAAPRIERALASVRAAIMRPSPRAWAFGVALLGATLALASGWWLFRLQPVAGDEYAQRFHALIVSHGRLSIPVALPREFFSTAETLDVDGRWFSQFPVGWPAVLAIGVLTGVPWLLNPLLTGVATVALYAFARRTTDETTARWSSLLACACTFIVFMGGTQMNHTVTLALLWIAFAALAHLCDETNAHRRRTALVIGLCIGTAAAIRPFDAFVCALLIGAFQLIVLREREGFWNDVAIQCIAAAIPVALLLTANTFTLGAPLPFAYDVLNGPEHRPGFHVTPLGFDHTPRRGLYMASAYLMKLNIVLFTWPVPAVLVIVAVLCCIRNESRWDRLLIALMIAFIAGYAGYWAESYFIGPRFLFILAPAFVLYTARSPGELRARIISPTLRAAIALLFPLWFIASWIPSPIGTAQTGTRRFAHLAEIRSAVPAVLDAVHRQHLSNSVVFVRDGWRERLTARLRALGVRPLAAEQMILRYDACALQGALDSVDGDSRDASVKVASILQRLDADRETAPPVMTNARVMLVPSRALSPVCNAEVRGEPQVNLSLAELQPYSTLDQSGAFSGDVIYARDFGARNAVLMPQFGSRTWYVALPAKSDDSITVRLERIH